MLVSVQYLEDHVVKLQDYKVSEFKRNNFIDLLKFNALNYNNQKECIISS